MHRRPRWAADLTLRDEQKGAALLFTHGFNVPQVGSYKRRACHVPATCVPPTASLLKPGALAAADVAVAGSARAAGGGRLQLVDGRNQKGAAYLKRRARFTEGFEANFSFRIEAKAVHADIFGPTAPTSTAALRSCCRRAARRRSAAAAA